MVMTATYGLETIVSMKRQMDRQRNKLIPVYNFVAGVHKHGLHNIRKTKKIAETRKNNSISEDDKMLQDMILKEIKQELITTHELAKTTPVKHEERQPETVKSGPLKPSTVQSNEIKLEDKVLLLKENPEDSFLKISFKLDPYDDSVIYMGKTIEPFIIHDDESDDELLYISTTREITTVDDDDVMEIDDYESDTANNLEPSFVYISSDDCKMEIDEPAQQSGNKRKKRKSKKRKPKRKTSTPAGSGKHEADNVSENCTEKKEKGISEENSMGKVTTSTDSDKVSNSAESQDTTANTQPSNSHESSTPTGQNAECIPRKEDKQVQAFLVNPNLTNLKFLVRNKLGYIFNNSKGHLLKYATDFLTNEEFMFVYRPRDNYLRVFIKSEETELFLMSFYDLVTCQYAYRTTRLRVMQNFQKIIVNTIKQRRNVRKHEDKMCQNWSAFRIMEKLVRYQSYLIIMAVSNKAEFNVLIVCQESNCSLFRVYNNFMPDYSNLYKIYTGSPNLITQFQKQFELLKRTFLHHMYWQSN